MFVTAATNRVDAKPIEPDQVLKIVWTAKTAEIYYGPTGTAVQNVKISSFHDKNDDFGPVAFMGADFSADHKTAAVEIAHGNCCTSYPVHRTLAFYRLHQSTQIFSATAMIHDWTFYQTPKGRPYAAIADGPTHGNCSDFKLFDIRTGKVVETAPCDEPPPIWARNVANTAPKTP